MVSQCEICGKVFRDTSKGYKSEWYLKSHKNTCFRVFKKKQRKFIKDFSQNASDLEINRAYLFLKNPELYLKENMKIIEKEIVRQQSPISEDEDENSNCEYEKEYLHDTYSDTSESDRESNASPQERPATPDLKIWNVEDSSMQYYIDDKDNVYYMYNKTLLGKRYLNMDADWKINFI